MPVKNKQGKPGNVKLKLLLHLVSVFPRNLLELFVC
jgi:hypothetical protein